MAMQLGACPKCQGSLRRTSDEYGEFWLCMNCGKLVDTTPGPDLTLCRPPGGYTGGAPHIRRPYRESDLVPVLQMEWLAEERRKRGWTITEVAKRIGYNRRTIAHWESGESTMGMSGYLALKELFDATS